MAINAPIASEPPRLNNSLTEKQHFELNRINRKAKVVGWTPTPVVQMPNGAKMILLPNGEWMVA